jgi:hypothetical protein
MQKSGFQSEKIKDKSLKDQAGNTLNLQKICSYHGMMMVQGYLNHKKSLSLLLHWVFLLITISQKKSFK